jgi:hypothetical protein
MTLLERTPPAIRWSLPSLMARRPTEASASRRIVRAGVCDENVLDAGKDRRFVRITVSR